MSASYGFKKVPTCITIECPVDAEIVSLYLGSKDAKGNYYTPEHWDEYVRSFGMEDPDRYGSDFIRLIDPCWDYAFTDIDSWSGNSLEFKEIDRIIKKYVGTARNGMLGVNNICLTPNIIGKIIGDLARTIEAKVLTPIDISRAYTTDGETITSFKCDGVEVCDCSGSHFMRISSNRDNMCEDVSTNLYYGVNTEDYCLERDTILHVIETLSGILVDMSYNKADEYIYYYWSI